MRLNKSNLPGMSGREVGYRSLTGWEDDSTIPPAAFVADLCLLLDVNPAWLFWGKGQPVMSMEATTNREQLVVANWLRVKAQELDP